MCIKAKFLVLVAELVGTGCMGEICLPVSKKNQRNWENVELKLQAPGIILHSSVPAQCPLRWPCSVLVDRYPPFLNFQGSKMLYLWKSCQSEGRQHAWYQGESNFKMSQRGKLICDPGGFWSQRLCGYDFSSILTPPPFIPQPFFFKFGLFICFWFGVWMRRGEMKGNSR